MREFLLTAQCICLKSMHWWMYVLDQCYLRCQCANCFLLVRSKTKSLHQNANQHNASFMENILQANKKLN